MCFLRSAHRWHLRIQVDSADSDIVGRREKLLIRVRGQCSVGRQVEEILVALNDFVGQFRRRVGIERFEAKDGRFGPRRFLHVAEVGAVLVRFVHDPTGRLVVDVVDDQLDLLGFVHTREIHAAGLLLQDETVELKRDRLEEFVVEWPSNEQLTLIVDLKTFAKKAFVLTRKLKCLFKMIFGRLFTTIFDLRDRANIRFIETNI